MRYCTRGPSARASALISRLYVEDNSALVQKHLWDWTCLGGVPFHILSTVIPEIIACPWRRGRLALATHGISYACIVFLLASHGIVTCVCAGRIWVLLASLPRPNPLCQHSEFGFWLGTGKALWG